MSATYEELLRIFGDEWFSSFEPASQKLLLTQGRSLHVQRGGFVVRRGDAASGLFGVVSGVLAASSLLHDGRQIIFGLLESGDWCGEASSLDGLPRTHDIHALHDSELLHIAPPVFEKAMQDARFARAIAILQTARIRACTARPPFAQAGARRCAVLPSKQERDPHHPRDLVDDVGSHTPDLVP